ncbi:hypothetical protein V7161_27835 [Neobacillus drentensis]
MKIFEKNFEFFFGDRSNPNITAKKVHKVEAIPLDKLKYFYATEIYSEYLPEY